MEKSYHWLLVTPADIYLISFWVRRVGGARHVDTQGGVGVAGIYLGKHVSRELFIILITLGFGVAYFFFFNYFSFLSVSIVKRL